jgi:hypothetical protein
MGGGGKEKTSEQGWGEWKREPTFTECLQVGRMVPWIERDIDLFLERSLGMGCPPAWLVSQPLLGLKYSWTLAPKSVLGATWCPEVCTFSPELQVIPFQERVDCTSCPQTQIQHHPFSINLATEKRGSSETWPYWIWLGSQAGFWHLVLVKTLLWSWWLGRCRNSWKGGLESGDLKPTQGLLQEERRDGCSRANKATGCKAAWSVTWVTSWPL